MSLLKERYSTYDAPDVRIYDTISVSSVDTPKLSRSRSRLFFESQSRSWTESSMRPVTDTAAVAGLAALEAAERGELGGSDREFTNQARQSKLFPNTH